MLLPKLVITYGVTSRSLYVGLAGERLYLFDGLAKTGSGKRERVVLRLRRDFSGVGIGVDLTGIFGR